MTCWYFADTSNLVGDCVIVSNSLSCLNSVLKYIYIEESSAAALDMCCGNGAVSTEVYSFFLEFYLAVYGSLYIEKCVAKCRG